MSEELAEELALLVAIATRNDILQGTPFLTFDRYYPTAKEFVEKYPLSTVWGVEDGLEYEETVVEFFTKKLIL